MYKSNAAFTLIEVIMILAVLAVIAGMMAPYAVKEIEASRQQATLRELGAIEDGLVAYYRDCGQLPDEKIGLVALARNAEGLSDWSGPYVGGSGDVEVGIVQDAWGADYTYVRDAQIKGATAVFDFLVLSPGRDRTLDSQLMGGQWTLDTAGDLILRGLTQTVDQSWGQETRQRLREYEDGLAQYYRDVGAFPAGSDSVALVALVSGVVNGWSGPYVRETVATVARDAWGAPIILRPCTEVNGEAVTGWLLLSYGAGPPDARAKGSRWQTGQNDIYRVLSAGRLRVLRDQDRIEETRRELKLLAAEILVAHPQGSPESGPLATADPWGLMYQYAKQAVNAGVLYSYGPDGLDGSGGDDDIYEPLSWPLPVGS